MLVNVTLKRVFADVINIEILRLSRWALSAITSILNKREAEKDYTQKMTQCDQRGRYWNDAATSQGMPSTTRSWKR